jgi:nucleotide-binding universal stress UspA family protein
MSDPDQILVAIDDFQRAGPLLDDVVKMARGSRDAKIHLFHAVGPLPPQLLESPGAEGGRQEEHVERRQERQQDIWFEKVRKAAEPQFASAKARLVAADIAANHVETHLQLLNQREDLVAEIIKAARAHGCGIIVVGRNAYPWLREQFHTHVSDSLISKKSADGLAIRVVNELRE